MLARLRLAFPARRCNKPPSSRDAVLVLLYLRDGAHYRYIYHQKLLSRNFSEQRKLRIHNGFSHLGHEIIIENFI